MATVLTSQGITVIRDSLTGGAAPLTADYIGWGTGAGGAVKGDVALWAEASTGVANGGETRVLGARSVSGLDVLQWVGTLTANSAKTITNAGTFTYGLSSGSATYGNVLFIHGDFTGIPLATNDRIQFTVNLQIS